MTLEQILQMKVSNLEQLIRQNFKSNLTKILEERDITYSELMKNLNISSTTKWGYKTDNTFPSTSVLLKISVFLNVTINDLLLPEEINTYHKLQKDSDDVINSKLNTIMLMLSDREKKHEENH